MQLCRYQVGQRASRWGILRGDQVIPVESLATDLPGTLAGLMDLAEVLPQKLEGWQTALAVEPKPTLLQPVPAPEKVICIGLNYRDHAKETNAAIPTEPVVFSKFPSALSGPYDPIVLPAIAFEVDYEAELVVVIGKTTRQVSVDQAMKSVFGYCCGHDVSARDWQKGKPGGQWLLGKTFDTFAPIGPAITLRSAVPDPGKLAIKMSINGEVLQESNTSELIFSIPELISYVSQVVTLRPGDLIFTGTPAGVGAARKPPRFLKPNDLCRVEIEGLGAIENRCVSATGG